MARKTLAGWRIAAGIVLGGLAGHAQAIVSLLDQPKWAALAPEQKAILAPLAQEWDAMEPYRRKKWLGIAQRYPNMSPAEQASMQRNMQEWARFAPEERKAAREKFKALEKARPEERQALKQRWEEYKALPPEERERLRAEATRRPQTLPKPPAGSAPRSTLAPLKPPHSALPPGGAPPAPKE